jgi:hypothetical protein
MIPNIVQQSGRSPNVYFSYSHFHVHIICLANKFKKPIKNKKYKYLQKIYIRPKCFLYKDVHKIIILYKDPQKPLTTSPYNIYITSKIKIDTYFVIVLHDDHSTTITSHRLNHANLTHHIPHHPTQSYPTYSPSSKFTTSQIQYGGGTPITISSQNSTSSTHIETYLISIP